MRTLVRPGLSGLNRIHHSLLSQGLCSIAPAQGTAEGSDVAQAGAPRPKAQRAGLLPLRPSEVLDVGRYHILQPHLIPEAFPQLHNAFYSPKSGGRQAQQEDESTGTEPRLPRKGGCKGLQQEMQVAGSLRPMPPPGEAPETLGLLTAQASSGQAAGNQGNSGGPAVMWRSCLHRLHEELTPMDGQEPAGPRRLLLRGPAGSGKSIALATMVERCRAAGWLALYVPSATALTSGGYFLPRAPASSAQANGKPSPVSTQEGGAAGAPPPAPAGSPDTSYDTLISAQHILLGMQQAHGPQLGQLGLHRQESRQLLRAAGWAPSVSPGAEGSRGNTAADQGGQGKEAAEAAPASGGVQSSEAAEGAPAGGGVQSPEAAEAARSREGASRAGDSNTSRAVENGEAQRSDKGGGGEVPIDARGVGAATEADARSRSSGGTAGTLLDLVMAGLATDLNAALAVDACLALVAELDVAAEQKRAKVLLAIDDYNALGLQAPTGYGAWEGVDAAHGGAGTAAQEGRLVRRPLSVSQLTLARTLRLLGTHGAAVRHAQVLCAESATAALPMRGPQDGALDGQGVEERRLPRYSKAEVARALFHYYQQGVLNHLPSTHLVNRMLALTNGDATQLRRLLPESSLIAGRRHFPIRQIPDPSRRARLSLHAQSST